MWSVSGNRHGGVAGKETGELLGISPDLSSHPAVTKGTENTDQQRSPEARRPYNSC